jgi:hypothetical protein
MTNLDMALLRYRVLPDPRGRCCAAAVRLVKTWAGCLQPMAYPKLDITSASRAAIILAYPYARAATLKLLRNQKIFHRVLTYHVSNVHHVPGTPAAGTLYSCLNR